MKSCNEPVVLPFIETGTAGWDRYIAGHEDVVF